MPDRDIVERGLPKRWRPVYRLWKGGHVSSAEADALRTRAQLVELYRAYCREWDGFPTPLSVLAAAT